MSLESQLDGVLDAISPEMGGMVDAGFYKLRFSSDEDSNSMWCALAWREAIAAQRRAEVARTIVGDDSAWDLGGFDFDPRDGSLSFRIGVLHAREVLSVAMVRELVRISVTASESLRQKVFGASTAMPAQANPDEEPGPAQADPFRAAILGAFEQRAIEVEEDPSGQIISVFLESERSEYLMAVLWSVSDRTVICSGRYLFELPPSRHEEAIPAICAMNCELVVGKVGLELDDRRPWFSHGLYVPPEAELTEEIVGSAFDYCWLACHEHDEQLRAFRGA